MAIERKETLFLDGPSTFLDGMKKNFDHVQLGMSWYLGTPWQVRDIKGLLDFDLEFDFNEWSLIQRNVNLLVSTFLKYRI